MAQIPSTFPRLFDALRTLDPTAPRLTWYGPDAERVELSGRVLENWVAKTANFLADELDAEPGTVVAVDVPVHWRSLVWLLATWAVGATAVAGEGAAHSGAATVPGAVAMPFGYDRADIVATTNPAAAAAQLATARTDGARANPVLVAVALPALAMRWAGGLPDGAVDYSGEVRAHADVFFPGEVPAADAIAWETPGGAASFAQLLAPAGTVAAQPVPERVLLQARDGWDGVVRAALHTWARGGSIVLLDTAVTPTDHLRRTENVTLG